MPFLFLQVLAVFSGLGDPFPVCGVSGEAGQAVRCVTALPGSGRAIHLRQDAGVCPSLGGMMVVC